MVTDYEFTVIFIQKVLNYNLLKVFRQEYDQPFEMSNEQTYCCMTPMQILPFFPHFFYYYYLQQWQTCMISYQWNN